MQFRWGKGKYVPSRILSDPLFPHGETQCAAPAQSTCCNFQVEESSWVAHVHKRISVQRCNAGLTAILQHSQNLWVHIICEEFVSAENAGEVLLRDVCQDRTMTHRCRCKWLTWELQSPPPHSCPRAVQPDSSPAAPSQQHNHAMAVQTAASTAAEQSRACTLQPASANYCTSCKGRQDSSMPERSVLAVQRTREGEDLQAELPCFLHLQKAVLLAGTLAFCF